MINYIQNEFYKLNSKVVLIIVATFSAIPFLATELFILAKGQSLLNSGVTLNLIQENAAGAWTTLLYPLLCMLLTQMVSSPEHETNSLNYYRSTVISWPTFYVSKAVVALIFVFLTSLLNTLLGLVTAITFQSMFGTHTSVHILSGPLLTTYMGAALYCLPIIFFHLLLCLTIGKSHVCFAIGLVVLIVGIPIINLTSFIYNPYLILVASRKLGLLNAPLILFSLILPMLSVGVFWFRQRLPV